MVPSQQSPAHMERKSSPMSCAIFNELRLEGQLCDVVISVDGTEFVAHKIILCGCSNYFRLVLEIGGDGDKGYFLIWVIGVPECISCASTSTHTLIWHLPEALVPPWTPALICTLMSKSSSGSGA